MTADVSKRPGLSLSRRSLGVAWMALPRAVAALEIAPPNSKLLLEGGNLLLGAGNLPPGGAFTPFGAGNFPL